MKYLVTMGLTILSLSSAYSQYNPALGFFNESWRPVYTEAPDYIEDTSSTPIPELLIQVDAADTLTPITPFIAGYNLNTFHGGKIYNKPGLLSHIQNLELPFFRFPGGSGSNYYFWDAVKPDKPEDVDSWLVKGQVKTNIKWGDEPGNDYLSLDSYYRLRDSTSSQGVHVVNYSYARYGRSEQPVQQAAHYAANWVRYDNGRTTFWEIGNENYGGWEAGYEIDTSLNLDGQARYLSGIPEGLYFVRIEDSNRNTLIEKLLVKR
jgi:hypothetical protein